MAAPKKVSKKFLDWLESWEGEKPKKKDISEAEDVVLDQVPEEWRKDRRQFEALVSIVYDMGAHILTSPHNSLSQVLKTKYSPAKERRAGLSMLLLNKTAPASHKAGEIRRRAAQRHLFTTGGYNYNS